jgi:hypothetical protein
MRAALVILAVAALVCCKKGSTTSAPDPDPPAPKQDSLLDQIPASAKAALVVRESAVGPLVTRWLADPPEMKKELSEYYGKHLGVDPTNVQGLVAYVLSVEPPSAAMLVRLPPGGALKAKKAEQHEGVDIYSIVEKIVAAQVPAGLVLGTPQGVRAAIDLSKKKQQPLGPGSPLADLLKADTPGAEFLLAADPSVAPDPSVAALVGRYGVRSVTATFDHVRRATLSVFGDKEKLTQGRVTLVQLIDTGLKKMEEMRAQAVAQPEILTATSAIVGYHSMRKMVKEVEPKLEGDRLFSSYRFPKDTSQLMFAYLGVASAVAIPAFIKYTRKSKTVEATEGLDKIMVGAKAYFQTDHYDQNGTLLPKAFPASTDWTPAKGCCGGPGNKCQPDADAWAKSPWKELHFSLSDPHYYQFRFESKGTGKDATFVAEARGDLNCNGVFSSYRFLGSVDDEFSVVAKGPIIENEIE